MVLLIGKSIGSSYIRYWATCSSSLQENLSRTWFKNYLFIHCKSIYFFFPMIQDLPSIINVASRYFFQCIQIVVLWKLTHYVRYALLILGSCNVHDPAVVYVYHPSMRFILTINEIIVLPRDWFQLIMFKETK